MKFPFIEGGRKTMRKIETFKKWSLLIAFLLLASCSNEETSYTPEEAGNEVIDLLREENFQTIYNDWFDDDLKESLSADELEMDWERLMEESGDFIEIQTLQSEGRGEGVNTVEANMVYSDLLFDIRMIFNEQQRLIGFHLSDGTANITLPDSITEEEIIVGEETAYPLDGILTMPKDNQENLPVVILVHGSGPSDRDEAVFAYKPFRDIAWDLAEQGIASVRYDKRTYTHGKELAQDTTVYEETVEDAVLATDLAKSDNRIDENNVFLIGHSLGGMLAPRIDAQGGDYAGLIILAGSPRTLWEIVYDQNMELIENYIADEAEKEEQTILVEEEYQKAQQLGDMTDEEALGMNVFGMNGYYLKEMDQFDVAATVSELEKPLFILQGEDDFQVDFEKDFMLWQDLLEGRENATFKSYPNLNHFFIDYEGPNQGTVAEYETPNQVEPEVIEDIGAWILEN